MAISLQSASPNELLLRDALNEQGLSFVEQYPIYEGGKFSQPKYFVDFYITYKEKKLIVECDGYSYHTSDYDVDKNIERDNWIKSKTGTKIMHFTSNQLKREMPTVIAIIKNELKIEKIPQSKLKFKGKKKRTKCILNVNDSNLHSVELYYDYIRLKDIVWLTYKFKDLTLGKFSDVRIRSFYNVPDKLGNELSLFVALLDLKRSTEIRCYCQSEFLSSYFNKEMSSKTKSEILKKINEILKNHNYIFEYINIKRGLMYYYAPRDEMFILTELHEECKEIRSKYLETFSKENYEDFQKFIMKHEIRMRE